MSYELNQYRVRMFVTYGAKDVQVPGVFHVLARNHVAAEDLAFAAYTACANEPQSPYHVSRRTVKYRSSLPASVLEDEPVVRWETDTLENADV